MAGERLGASFSIDVTDLKTGLAQANRLIRESESQFKSAAAGLDDWTKSEQGLNAKIKSLNEITEIQRKKVSALKQEYQRLIDSGLDPASREAVQLRTRINNEEAALKSNEKALKQQTSALKDVSEGADDAGESFSRMGELAKAAGKVAAAAFAAAGAAVGALLKSSIEGYAEYEQLVGGVETLFKDSGGKLIEYANEAYKTAGMSANEYMANVTGFSAALISSLGGDTEKAADTADRAMRDMSDNANKMGTDINSIVDTYQSLARGNYQMLDNLKLGYGGTKTELERLIADASKMTKTQKELNVSVKEGDLSFANIVNAISVVQSEMGIMGTTAQEASTTIQGSVSSMKSAWSNLTAALADENANIDQLITNFIDSVGSVAENLLPRITVAIDGLLKVFQGLIPQIPPLIAEFLPVVIEGIMGLLDGIVAVLPTVIDTILEVIPQLITALLEMIPTILDALVNISVQIIQALAEMLPTIVDAIMDILPLLIDSLVASIPLLLEASIQLLLAIVQAIPVIVVRLIEDLPHIIETIMGTLRDAIPQLVDGAIQLFMAMMEAIPVITDALIENLPTIISVVVDTLIANIGAMIDGAIQLFSGLIKAIPIIIPQLAAQMPQIISAIVDGLLNAMSPIVDVGASLIEGLWEGIAGAGEWLWGKVTGFFGGVVDGIKDFFGIHSPSKLMEDVIGKNLALGIGVGFEEEMDAVNKKINNAIHIDDVGINARIAGTSSATDAAADRSVIVYQTNNYSQAHSRYEIYQSKKQTMAAVQLALAGV